MDHRPDYRRRRRGAALTYSCFTGDLLKQLSGIERTRAIALLTLFPIGPLALLRDLSALKHSTIAGLMAVAVSALVIVSRSLDGSYGEGGAFAGWLASSGERPRPGLDDATVRGLRGAVQHAEHGLHVPHERRASLR